MILENFKRSAFVRDYWQRRPLLIPHSGPAFVDPLTPEDLAGLACEPEMESRIVQGAMGSGWKLEHGPFEARTFSRLGNRAWTLLVQAVDQVLPAVNHLKQHFDFVPSWRIDDVMVSFASDGGGVGPHFDQYDVFLIQGRGSRRWLIGDPCPATSLERTDSGLRLLADFQPTAEFVLRPGDILYLPPRIPHHGISLGESLNYSVGFRGGSMAEMLQGFTDRLIELASEDLRYTDSKPVVPASPARLDSNSLRASFEQLKAYIDTFPTFVDWFGEYSTLPRYPERIIAPRHRYTGSKLSSYIHKDSYHYVFKKNPASRFAYFHARERVRLFVDAKVFDCDARDIDPIASLCNTPWHVDLPAARYLRNRRMGSTMADLLNQGSLSVRRTRS